MPKYYALGKLPYKPNNYSKPNNSKPWNNMNKPWNKPFNAAPVRPQDVFRKGGINRGNLKGANSAPVNDDVKNYFDNYQKQDALFDWFNKKEIDFMQKVYSQRDKPARNIFQKIHRGMEKMSFGMYKWLRKNVMGDSTSEMVNNVAKYGIDAAKMFFDIYSAGGITAAEASLNLVNDAASRWGPDVLQRYGITNVSGKDINSLMYNLERIYSDHNMKIDTSTGGKPVAVPKAPVQINNVIPKGPAGIRPNVVPTTDNKLNIEQNMSNPNNKDPDAPVIDLTSFQNSHIDFSNYPILS